MARMRDTFPCPNCGEDVPAGAPACPECGSDARTGWSDETVYDGLGLEDPDEFDYDDWLRREQQGGAAWSPRQTRATVIAAILLALLLYFVLRR